MAQVWWLQLLLVLVLGILGSGVKGDDPVVTTSYGQVRGVNNGKSLAFLGVPYAAPPVGPLRWAPPQAPSPWSGVLSATSPRPGCPQYMCQKLSPPEVCPNSTSEDCLYLNIWTPVGSNVSSGLAVMVYLHGGNFVHMSGGSPIYDGRFLAERDDVILVNVDYRLGALGFLVTGRKQGDAVGNYGILDQVQALKFVHDNIKSFGGDPNRVTLFGQSAGAQSTLAVLTLESAAGYFRNSIIESSPLSIPYKKFGEAIILGALFAEFLNCTPRDMDCLRTHNPDDIAYAQYQCRSKISSPKLLEAFEPWGPWIDGEVLKEEPIAALQAGHVMRKPMMIGTTSEETVLYIFSAWSHPVDNILYGEVVLATYPGHAAKILYMYPPGNPRDERNTMVSLSTDLVFICSTRNVSRSLVQYHGNPDIWHYVWSHAFSFPGWGKPLAFCQGRVCHGSEVPFVFHSAGLGGFQMTSDEERLSQEIAQYWANFAKYGDPNGPEVTRHRKKDGVRDVIQWPRYSKENHWSSLDFDVPSLSLKENINGPYCDFWDQVGYAA